MNVIHRARWAYYRAVQAAKLAAELHAMTKSAEALECLKYWQARVEELRKGVK